MDSTKICKKYLKSNTAALWLCLLSFTTVVSALQIHLFMQNEPNFRKSQMNVSPVNTMDYDKKTLGQSGKNEPKTNPNEPNFKKAKMNVTSYITVDYENISNWAICENEPKTNPTCRGVASGEAGSNPTCSELVEPISKEV